jgi:hypothetical protein
MAVWRGQRGADFGLALAQVEVKLWYFLNWLEGENRRALAKADLCDNYLVLLRHEFLRDDRPSIGALQQGHRGRLLTRAPISRRRMVAIEFGM